MEFIGKVSGIASHESVNRYTVGGETEPVALVFAGPKGEFNLDDRVVIRIEKEGPQGQTEPTPQP